MLLPAAVFDAAAADDDVTALATDRRIGAEGEAGRLGDAGPPL